MLKLTLVGCGNPERLSEYVRVLQKDLTCFIKQYNFLIYNLDKLSEAECDFNKLKKPSHLCFSSKKYTESEYWGIFSNSNLSEYYSRWFEEQADPYPYYVSDRVIPYCSQEKLKEFVNKWSDTAIEIKNSRFFDLKIEYEYIKDINKDRCILGISLNKSEMHPSPKSIFQDIIKKMDESFPDVFVSANVSDEQTDFNDSDNQGYIYDPDLLESKILNAGFMVYLSEKIEKSTGFERKNDIAQFSTEPLSNGTLYINKMIDDKCEKLNKSDQSVFSDIIIPGYRLLNWTDLYKVKFFSISDEESVSVFSDKFSPTDPTIIFSRGYNSDQLKELAKEYDTKYVATYSVEMLKS